MIKAVVFDLGGVVLESPLKVIADFETANRLSQGAVNKVILYGGNEGPWACLERGEISMENFYQQINEIAQSAGVRFSAQKLMASFDKMAHVRPQMINAVRSLRKRGLTVAALTNNWKTDGPLKDRFSELRGEFDIMVESWKVGLRKPQPEIYQLLLQHLGTHPCQTVFLDDFGVNLKPARAIGMHTIKVTHMEDGLNGLCQLFGALD